MDRAVFLCQGAELGPSGGMWRIGVLSMHSRHKRVYSKRTPRRHLELQVSWNNWLTPGVQKVETKWLKAPLQCRVPNGDPQIVKGILASGRFW